MGINDTSSFYTVLLEQLYRYQLLGHILSAGDFNSRCGELADHIKGVDLISPRDVIDFTTNDSGHQLIDLLIDCNICMVNGRIGSHDFTSFSKRGRAVVDYVIVPHEQLDFIRRFNVHTMSEIGNKIGYSS